jgi:hypothetical protein
VSCHSGGIQRTSFVTARFLPRPFFLDEKMASFGSVISVMSPEEANAFIVNQYEKFRALVDKLGMRIEG